MNKLLLFPLIFLFIMALYDWTGGGQSTSGQVPVYGDGTIYVTNDTVNQSGSFYIAEDATFDFWDVAGTLAILIASIVVGAVVTMNFIGTGLQDFSGNVIFQSCMFLGLWTALSYGTVDFFTGSMLTLIVYIFLLLLFMVGFANQVSMSGE